MNQSETLARMVALAEQMKTAIAAGKGDEANKLADEIIRLGKETPAPRKGHGLKFTKLIPPGAS
ncbi:MAG TPA: hypothetical protein PKK06_05035 [Phycisphaerae bacterium]|nr:hypothetical protein [Phycisphaerae bacterium]